MTLTSKGPSVIIVGSGHGIRVHLPALMRAGFQVAGLVGRNPGKTRAIADENDIPGAFTDIESAISQTRANAVTVASPPHTHGKIVSKALEFGCHILCEKPFARDAKEAAELLTGATNAGVVHMIGNQMRSSPDKIVIARAIADGLIGEPRFASFIQYVNLVADPDTVRPPWWFDPHAGGGWLGASGSHMIDQIRNWLGDFSTLSASTPVVSDRTNVAEDSFGIRFQLVSGVEGIISQSGGCWGPTVLMNRVMGTRGTIWLENGQVRIADRAGERTLPVPEALQLEAMEPSTDPRKKYLHIELPPSIRMCEAWRDAIEGRKPLTGYATFEDGLACMKVIDAVRESVANNGATVAVN